MLFTVVIHREVKADYYETLVCIVDAENQNDAEEECIEKYKDEYDENRQITVDAKPVAVGVIYDSGA